MVINGNSSVNRGSGFLTAVGVVFAVLGSAVGVSTLQKAIAGTVHVKQAVAGFSVLLLGMALLVVPIPGTSVVVIPLGLTILAREYAWARRLRDRSTGIVKQAFTWTSAHGRSLLRTRPLVPATAHRV